MAAIVLLRQGQDNHIQRISMQQAYPVLFQQSYRRAGGEGLPHTLDLVGKLAGVGADIRTITVPDEDAKSQAG